MVQLSGCRVPAVCVSEDRICVSVIGQSGQKGATIQYSMWPIGGFMQR